MRLNLRRFSAGASPTGHKPRNAPRAKRLASRGGASGLGFILTRGIHHRPPQCRIRPTPWVVNEDASQYAEEIGRGMAYEDVIAEGYRALIYVLNVEGTLLSNCDAAPYTTVSETAAKISSPPLLVQILVGLLLLFAIPFFSTRIIQPSTHWQKRPITIARQFDVPVAISGEDEVAQPAPPLNKCGSGFKNDSHLPSC